ncbi:MAG: branched-chain amino acid ABC transporter permease [Candidatus Bipolaricaulota bacterium]|nr:branched-chain amino acid ABC transporter permease [Candidatus Bipolaricaulota bacterium]MDW8030415.1 branched-chain amino acid ABC transporter permease [Candidatus Bipolaricaulota bacterium]
MLELTVYGIIYGSIIALGAIGLTLIYGILRFANFAHGDLMSVGAYIALFLIQVLFPLLGVPQERLSGTSFGWPLILAMPLSALVTALLAIALDQMFYRPLRARRASPVIIAMASLGAAFIVRNLIYIIWGPDKINYFPGLYRPAWQLPFDVRIRPDELIIVVLALSLVALVYLFLQKTKLGKAMRATADNPDLARVTGINTEQVRLWTWGIGAGLAAIAGIMYGVNAQLYPEMGWSFLLPLFAATVLGTVGNPYGALVGGLVIGVVQRVSTVWLNPAYQPAVAFLILIVVLLVRPQGIFGGRS